MKKKMLKRSLALGALMAFVITGSAMAAETVIADKNTLTNSIVEGSYATAQGTTIGAKGSETTELVHVTTSDALKTITITNTNQTDANGVKASDDITGGAKPEPKGIGAKIDLGTVNTEKITIDVKGGKYVAGILAMKGAEVNVKTKDLYIDVYSENAVDSAGIWVQGNNNSSTKVTIDAENTVIKATCGTGSINGLVAMSGSNLEIKSNLSVTADNAILTRGDSVIKINEDGKHSTQLNGDIAFDYDKATSGTKVDSKIFVNLNGANSYWNGNTKLTWGTGVIPEGKENVTGINLSINNGATWNPTYVAEADKGDSGTASLVQNNVTLNGGKIDLTNTGKQQIKVENLSGNGGTINVGSAENSMAITQNNTATNLTVGATQAYSEELAKGDVNAGLQNLANQVVDNSKVNAEGQSQSAADKVVIQQTGVLGEISGAVDKNGVVDKNTVVEKVNTVNAGIAGMAGVNMVTWRQENDDMNKRLGEIRNGGEVGVWARMTRGELEYDGASNQYNRYQLGYDEKINDNWVVGGALTYTEGKSAFAEGSGENKHKGLVGYMSYLGNEGKYMDFVAKYAVIDSDFDAFGGAGKGSYDNHAYSLSAEYGQRFEKENGFWVEPQAQLTYGKVDSADCMTSEGVLVTQDSADSLVGRLGFAIGKNVERGNVFVSASYLYDFAGEAGMSFSNGKDARSFEQDFGGGWFEVGVGTNYNLSDNTYVYAELEKAFGGEVDTNWQWNAGVRYSF